MLPVRRWPRYRPTRWRPAIRRFGELDAAKASDPLAAYAAGSVQFFVALEKLAGGLHRHGFESPQSFMLPLMRLPVPANPNPEPLTYEGFRQILSDFRDGDGAIGGDAGAWCRPAPTSGWRSTSPGSASTSTRTARSRRRKAPRQSWRRCRGGAAPPDASAAGVPLRPRRRLLAAGLCQLPDGAVGFLAGA